LDDEEAVFLWMKKIYLISQIDDDDDDDDDDEDDDDGG